MRIAVNIILVFSFLFFPWWLPAIIACFAALIIPNFIEAFILGSLYDIVFGGGAFHTGIYIGLILFLISLWAPRSLMIYVPWPSK